MIRRFLPILLCLCLLTGCDRPFSPAAPLTEGFTCSFSGSCGGLETAGTLTRPGPGMLTLTLTAPPELAGLTLTWDGEQVTAGLLGLSFSLPQESVPGTALGAELTAALDGARRGEGAPDGQGRFATAGGGGDDAFTLYSHPDTGALLSLSMPGRELELTFSDFSPQKQ